MGLIKSGIQDNCNIASIGVALSLFCLGMMVPSETSAQGFFGPKDYDDCILQNMRGVTSDTAAGLVHRSCLAKFPKEEPKIQNNLDSKGVLGKAAVCEVFWDGRKFNKGTPAKGFTTLRFAMYGVESHHVSIPEEMNRDFQSRKSKFDMEDSQDPWSIFWRTNYYQIEGVCAKK